MRHVIVTRFSVPRPQDPAHADRHHDRVWLDRRLELFFRFFLPSVKRLDVPAVLLALVQLGPGPAILVGAGFLVANVVLGNLVEPQLMGRTLGMSTLVVFLSLVFWGWLWGPVGMFLSVPLTMILKIGMENSRDLKPIAIMLDSPRAATARLEAAAESED